MEFLGEIAHWFLNDLIGGNWGFYIESLPRLLVAGLLEGLILAVIALAFVLIYRTTEIVNFAQGDYMAMAIFLMLVFSKLLGPEVSQNPFTNEISLSGGILSVGMAWFVSALLTIACMVLFSMASDVVIFRHLAGQSPLTIVIITIALGFIIRNSLDVLVEPGPADIVPYPLASREQSFFGLFGFDSAQLAVLVAVPVLIGAIVFFLNRTKAGLAVQASSQNQMAAYYMGIPVPWLNTVVWGIAGALTAGAGILYAMIVPERVNSAVGLTLQGGILAYAAAIAGGFGSINGAITTAVLLGITHQLLQGAPGIPSFIGVNAPILFLLAVLLFRPDGLFSQMQAKKV